MTATLDQFRDAQRQLRAVETVLLAADFAQRDTDYLEQIYWRIETAIWQLEHAQSERWRAANQQPVELPHA